MGDLKSIMLTFGSPSLIGIFVVYDYPLTFAM